MKQEMFLWNQLVFIRWRDHALQLLHCNYWEIFSSFQKSGIFFHSMSVGLVLWIWTNRKRRMLMECVSMFGQAAFRSCWGCFLWKDHSHFVFFWSELLSSGCQQVCWSSWTCVSPDQSRRRSCRVCYLNHRRWWRTVRRSDSAEATGRVSQCVCSVCVFDK